MQIYILTRFTFCHMCTSVFHIVLLVIKILINIFREMPAAFSRPWDCAYSLASLMQPPEDAEKSVVRRGDQRSFTNVH